jgi:hypothetical protein
MYMRTYLARQAHAVAPNMKDYLMDNFNSFVRAHERFKGDKFDSQLVASHVKPEEYFNLFSPALDWQLQCIGHNANQVTTHNKFFLFIFIIGYITVGSLSISNHEKSSYFETCFIVF